MNPLKARIPAGEIKEPRRAGLLGQLLRVGVRALEHGKLLQREPQAVEPRGGVGDGLLWTLPRRGGRDHEGRTTLGPRGQQPVERRDARLQSEPGRDTDRARVGHGNTEVLHPLLEAAPMASLGLGHLAQDRSVALAHASRDQLVYGPSQDLAPPRLQ